MTAAANRASGGSWRGVLHPRWIIATLLVLAASLVMVRLGFWQLDRLEQRRAVNIRIQSGLSQPPLDLNAAIPLDLPALEYRQVIVRGTYDFTQQVLLRNQAFDGQAGYHLLTPLLIAGSDRAVLVNRGFIPLAEGSPEGMRRYDQPGQVAVSGQILRSQPEPRFAGVPDPQIPPGQTRLAAWNFINLERIALQTMPPLLDVYLLAAPDPTLGPLPSRSLPEVDLSEGPHLGYAAQWFIFAAILLLGYPFYVRNQLRTPTSRP